MLESLWSWLGEKTGAQEEVPPSGPLLLERLEPRVLLDADLVSIQPFSCRGVALDDEAIVVDLNRESDSYAIATLPVSSGQTSLTEQPDTSSQSQVSDLGPVGQNDVTEPVLATGSRQAESISQVQAEQGISTALGGEESISLSAAGQQDNTSPPESLPIQTRGPPSVNWNDVDAVSYGTYATSAESLVPIKSPVSHTEPFAGVDIEPSTAPSTKAFDPLGFPASYDLRSSGDVSPVKDQASAGTCWIFATYGSLESTILVDGGSVSDLSENHLKNYHGFDPSPTSGGNCFETMAYLSRWDGPVSEAADPYHDYYHSATCS